MVAQSWETQAAQPVIQGFVPAQHSVPTTIPHTLRSLNRGLLA